MRKIIFLCLIFVNIAFGYNYDDLLLKAQASIFPKILLLDKEIKDKLIDDKIVYSIIYDKSDYDTALEIVKLIDKKHGGYFDQYAYIIKLVEFADLSVNTKASAFYVLNSDKYIKKAASIAKKQEIISFSYDVANLKNALLCSLMIEKSTVIYLSKKSISTQKVDFVDALLQMSKFVDNK